jgi:hypothetical protein
MASALWAQSPPSSSSAFDEFSKRVDAYVAIHKAALSKVHHLKPTPDPEAIERYEHSLAHQIRELRKHSKQGDIFTPEIAAEFNRVIRAAMQGPSGVRVEKSLSNAEPVRLPELRVDTSYPEHLPLQSTPPSFLVNLPKLPKEVEYRVVGHSLVLRDVDANLIIDFMRNAVP